MRVTPEINLDELQHFTLDEVAERARISPRSVLRDIPDPTCPLHGDRFTVRKGSRIRTCGIETLRDYLRWRLTR